MAKNPTPSQKSRLENLASGYPIATSKGTQVARPSQPEEDRYLKNLGQQPRGITSDQGTAMQKKRRLYNKSTY